METGAIALGELPGGFDLQATLESGQSYCWRRDDGAAYEKAIAHGGEQWYSTVVPGDAYKPPADRKRAPNGSVTSSEYEVIRARQVGDTLEWEGTTDVEAHLRRLLGLGDDLDRIVGSTPEDALLGRAYDRYAGLRIVRDPAFPSLISFICSAQMRVLRIHRMQRRLAREFGVPVEFDGTTYHAFPTPERLAAATESELRELSLGYRAPYVKRSARMVASGEAHPSAAIGLPFEDARERLKGFVGVGDKVADCVLLFALGYLEAVPLDTWIQQAIAEYYPDCDRGSYAETSRAIREAFGGEYAGYAQTYVFYHLRTGGE